MKVKTGYIDYAGGNPNDPGGEDGATQCVIGAMTTGTTSGSGFGVWVWYYPGSPEQNDQLDINTGNTLTSFGQTTASYIAKNPQ